MINPITTAEFIRRAKLFHEDRYIYTATTYVGFKTKVIITCHKHGDFYRFPTVHSRQGKGCPLCYNETLSINNPNRRWNKEKFIKSANTIHNYTYDYSLVEFISIRKKVQIICQQHGSFYQEPYAHMQGQGCKTCGYKKVRLQCANGNEKFISQAISKHDNKYNYDKVNYVNKDTKVTITCLKHGDFEQVPNSHIRGRGCKKCQNSRGEALITFYLEKSSINYITNKTFADLHNPITKQRLRFDFYLPDTNICIEYDGEQHFKPWRMKDAAKAKQRLKNCQYRDELKNVYCKEKGIFLVRIRYDEDIKDKLIFHKIL